MTGSKSGGGIYNAGTLTLSGGTITKNADGEKGGGVYNAGTFTMTGGKISANIAATGEGGYTCGGGVYNAENATFTMTGGEISGNYSCDTPNEDGGGVYNAGTFTVGGTAKITGNVAKAVYDYRTNSASGGVTDNVYLPSDKTITCSTETPLTSGASIGVTTQTAPTSGRTPVDITGGNSADYSGYFHSDKSYRVQNSDSASDRPGGAAAMARHFRREILPAAGLGLPALARVPGQGSQLPPFRAESALRPESEKGEFCRPGERLCDV
ncbi:MAG: hypothetical protein LKM35_05995 [Lachnospiraceae bacterium]|nr:hypothetical protein [Lachnospiraceae bacterium]